jgi:hypothetical protein
VKFLKVCRRAGARQQEKGSLFLFLASSHHDRCSHEYDTIRDRPRIDDLIRSRRREQRRASEEGGPSKSKRKEDAPHDDERQRTRLRNLLRSHHLSCISRYLYCLLLYVLLLVSSPRITDFVAMTTTAWPPETLTVNAEEIIDECELMEVDPERSVDQHFVPVS